MTKRVIHSPNSGEIQEEMLIHQILAEHTEPNAEGRTLVTGKTIQFPKDSLSAENARSLVNRFQKYNATVEVLNNKAYITLNRPRARPLWQQGLFKIYFGVSLAAGLYYLLHVPILDVLSYFGPPL